MVIGRFLLGAGLGGLVGAGLLATVSLTTPLRGDGGQGPASPDLTAAPVGETAADPAVETAAETAAETAPAGDGAPAPDAAMPDPQPAPAPGDTAEPAPAEAGEQGQDGAVNTGTAAAPMPDAVAESAAPPPSALPPAAADTAPDAPAAPEATAQPDAPADDPAAVAAAPADPSPEALTAPLAEAAPAAPEVPAAAPDAAVDAGSAPAPEAPAAPALAEGGADAAEIGPDLAPMTPAAPGEVALATPEPAPAPAEAPSLPPLTPEEQAMLAEIARNGPGSALPPGETAPPLIAPPVIAPPVIELPVIELPEGALDLPDAAPDTAPEVELAEASPAPATVIQDERKIVVGEGSTLPSTPPLIAAPADPPADPPADAPAGDAAPAIVAPAEIPAETAPDLPDAGGLSENLPQIGAEPAAPSADVAVAPPLLRNARAFDDVSGKPRFAVILIDTGDAAVDRDALADLPFPVSFALDPLAPGAADRAAIYRAAGQEVVMLTSGLPKGAAASDVEVAFRVMVDALPVAVAVMDMPDPLFQSDRATASLVVPVVGAEGLGLVSWDKGLNAADQVARREDVPATVAFRSLDDQNEGAEVIRRYLDRAAFKAAQEGRVTVIGTTRAETVAALLEWTVEGRAAMVTLAPVTAVLTVD